jgi:hypothetical protein
MRLVLALAGLLAAFLALPQAALAKVDIQVDLATQTMTVRSDSGESYVWPVSSARAGYVTPRGVYRPTSLQTMHYSRKYDNSPMPHSIFFRGGYAIHGTNDARNLGRPASHGCVRLSKANAAKLFAMVKAEGAVIAINGTPPRSTMLASAKPRATVARARAVEPSMGSVLGFAPVPAAAPSLRDWSKNPGTPFLLR